MKQIINILILISVISSCSPKVFTPVTEIQLTHSDAEILKTRLGRYQNKPNIKNAINESLVEIKNGNKDDFFDIFSNKIDSTITLWKIFKWRNKNRKTNKESIQNLKLYRTKVLNNVISVLNKRLNSAGYKNDIKLINNKIIVFLDKKVEKEKINKIITVQGNLEFWHTYKNTEIGNEIYENVNRVLSNRMYPGFADSIKDLNNLKEKKIDLKKQENELNSNHETSDLDINYRNDTINYKQDIISENQIQIAEKISPLSSYLYPYVNASSQWAEGPILGYAKITDTAIINKYFSYDFVKNVLPKRDLKFMWGYNTVTNKGIPLINLYLIKNTKSGIPELNDSHIKSTKQEKDHYTNFPSITIEFNETGKMIWEDITQQSSIKNTGIAITLDNKVFSAPIATAKISGGKTQITGGHFAKENGEKEVNFLINLINNKSLPLNLTIKKITELKDIKQ